MVHPTGDDVLTQLVSYLRQLWFASPRRLLHLQIVSPEAAEATLQP
jgi:hypothetical protein